MLTCIACSKQQLAEEGDEDTKRGTTASSTKPAVKSFTSQIKDVVLKLSGAYRQCKPSEPPSSSRVYQKTATHHYRSYGVMDYDDTFDRGGNSSNSTPARGFAPTSKHGKVSQFDAWNPPVLVDENEEPKEWVAQVEPGVHVTFVTLTHGGNDLKRIRFDREMFNKWQAQRWWGENYDRITELYNVQRFNRQSMPATPRSEDERESFYPRVHSMTESQAATLHGNHQGVTTITAAFNNNSNGSNISIIHSAPMATGVITEKEMLYPAPDPTEYFFLKHQAYNHSWASSCKAEAPFATEARTTTSSRDEASASFSNASDMMEATEWVEEDEPGVYVTIRQLADGTRDLRRVRFSRERFGEINAKRWWEENRDRIHAQYL